MCLEETMNNWYGVIGKSHHEKVLDALSLAILNVFLSNRLVADGLGCASGSFCLQQTRVPS